MKSKIGKHTKAQFGKYQGKTIDWIVENDLDYAKWLARGSNSTTMTKRRAQQLLDKLTNKEK